MVLGRQRACTGRLVVLSAGGVGMRGRSVVGAERERESERARASGHGAWTRG